MEKDKRMRNGESEKRGNGDGESGRLGETAKKIEKEDRGLQDSQ